MNLKDIWIGENLVIKSKNKIGTFEGRGAQNHAFVKIDGKMHLVNAEDLDVHVPKDEQPELQFEEEVKATAFEHFKTEIDLHMEVLNPDMQETNPLHILQYQIKQVELYVQTAIQRKKHIVKIIHGKGTGQLKEEVHHILKGIDKVQHFHVINDGGATEVYISN